METIDELEQYLQDECYSFDSISIGKHFAYEGLIVEKQENRFVYAYSERGKKTILKTFELEKDLVNYALKELEKDKWNRRHLVAWTWSTRDIEKAERVLKRKRIQFERNDIPYFKDGKTAYRIFVFGKDVLLLEKFKQKNIKK